MFKGLQVLLSLFVTMGLGYGHGRFRAEQATREQASNPEKQ
jgi:hypothetical protein